MRKTSLFLLAISLLALGGSLGSAGCGGDTGGGGGDAPVSFKADVLPIFRNSCGLSGSCHNNESGPGGQHFYGLANSAGEMSAAQIQIIFDQSVGKPAVVEPAMNVVTAGKPEQSFLMYKLDGDPMATDQITGDALKCVADATCGTSMPQGGPQLPAETRDIVRRWIAQGAKND